MADHVTSMRIAVEGLSEPHNAGARNAERARPSGVLPGAACLFARLLTSAALLHWRNGNVHLRTVTHDIEDRRKLTQLAQLLGTRFKAVDHIAVVRGNRTLEKPAYHKAAAEGNFFLRGFNHLLVFKKERGPRAKAR